MYEVSYNFWFDILQYFVKISNMGTEHFYKFQLVLIAYENNDLFPK